MLITVTFCMILISHGSVQLLLKNVVHLYMRKEPLYKTALGLYMYSSTSMQTWGTPKNLTQRSQTRLHKKISVSCDP